MASASSINTVSAAGNKNYISGLASGMDTDSIVESLLMGTQTKIDKQTGLKQQLEWKQETYRDLIGKINTFGDKYFSYYGSGQTNLMSPTTFKTMTGLSSNSAIKISSVSSNAVSSMKVDAVKQLATACTVKTAGTVTGEPVGNVVDFSQFAGKIGKTQAFTVTLDGVSKTIEFEVEEAAGPGVASGTVDADKTLANINQALYRNFGTAVGMKLEPNPDPSLSGTQIMKLVQLKTDGTPSDEAVNSTRRVIIETAGSSSEAKAVIANLGFKGGFSNKLDYGTSLKNMNFATPLQGGRYEFEINGVTIKGLTEDSTLSDVISAINSSDAGVKVSYSSASDKFIMQSSSTGEISNIDMKQTYGNLLTTMFGVEATGFQSSLFSEELKGASVNLESIVNDLNSGKNQSLTLEVDGKDFVINLEGKTGSEKYKDTESVIAAINSKLDKEYGSQRIKFSLEQDASAPPNQFVVIESSNHKVGFTADNLVQGITNQFGFTAGQNNVIEGSRKLADLGMTGEIYLNGVPFQIDASADQDLDWLAGKLGGTYDGGRINITGKSSGFSISGTAERNGNNLVESLFGSKSVTLTAGTNTITSKQVADTGILKGNLKLTLSDGTAKAIDLGAMAWTSGNPNFADLAAKINSELGGGSGVSVIYTADHRIQIQGTSQGFTIEGTDADGTALVNNLFGKDEMLFSSSPSVTSGQNAILTVDGTDIERNTNTFELDGITMEITSTYDALNGPISLTTSRDTDKIIDSLKSFVDDYNTLIEELNKQLTETANYKKYAPLTDAQKKEMSDKEVELWEEKSKQGLLHNDSNISSFLGDMRMALYSSVEGAGLSLYDIRIETSDNWRDNGKLVIDEDALRSAVATNADAIGALFTDRDQGLGVKMQNTIKAAANVSSGSPGSMVRYAGTKDVLTTSNTLYEEMKHITETLSNLNTKYQLEKTRYWKQFTAMEQAISNMNSQSSWLTQQFSS